MYSFSNEAVHTHCEGGRLSKGGIGTIIDELRRAVFSSFDHMKDTRRGEMD